MIFLGFDPGGLHQFGWCVSEARSENGLRVLHSGLADNAQGAVLAALANAKDLQNICAAGIDSPLYWPIHGKRKADVLIRETMRKLGARNIGGTVQSLNSLRGACVAQGIIAAHLLRAEIPWIRITENHPKALLWLMDVATTHRPVRAVRTSDMKQIIACDTELDCEHQRDAVLGTIAAWAMIHRHTGWRNLFLDEIDPFVPVPSVEYWMPIAI